MITGPVRQDAFRHSYAAYFHALLVATALATISNAVAATQPDASAGAATIGPDITSATDRIFEDYALDSHIPGIVYGIIASGRLAYVRGIGVQDLESRRPVTADTLFRIASMTKAFTALTVLKLRDSGKLRLDAPADSYVPELRDWKYPTTDSPHIRVRDLLNHTAGFVTDDPWGDRQTPLPEQEFSRLLRQGVPFARTPATAYEYSNLGFAVLGRIITNVSGLPYADAITRTLLQPLGMTSSGFVADAAPRERRALGYRWEDDAWRLEPTLGPGAFGAMGGLQTSATDYAKWVAFLLAAWPSRDGPESGPVDRATVRELAQGSNFPRTRQRPGRTGTEACRQAANYAMGMAVAADCDLGLTLSHGGGYPGYGSHVLLLPEYGVGIFALANRTYAGPSGPVWDAAMVLQQAGLLKKQPTPIAEALANAYRAVGAIYTAGDVAAGGDVLAMNFLMDRDAAGWARDIATLKNQVGNCDTTAVITPKSALAGEFAWRCVHGRLAGSVLLTPTTPTRIQAIQIERKLP
jgi:serine-type D-Ala-D-Ala carboxypeptidase/endopeptidase